MRAGSRPAAGRRAPPDPSPSRRCSAISARARTLGSRLGLQFLQQRARRVDQRDAGIGHRFAAAAARARRRGRAASARRTAPAGQRRTVPADRAPRSPAMSSRRATARAWQTIGASPPSGIEPARAPPPATAPRSRRRRTATGSRETRRPAPGRAAPAPGRAAASASRPVSVDSLGELPPRLAIRLRRDRRFL